MSAQMMFKFFLLLLQIVTLSVWSATGQEQSCLVYITPDSEKVPCPHSSKQCFTLSEFANKFGKNANLSCSLFELILLSGEHDLEYDIIIKNVDDIRMYSLSTPKVSQITCQVNETKFHFEQIRNVQINGLKFVGCGNNHAKSIENLTIEHTTFLGHNGSGTPLILDEANVTIVHSTFDSNVGGALVQDGTSLFYVGGAIVAIHSNMEVRDSNFVRNYARNFGGAIFTHLESNMTLTNTTFTENSVCNDSVETCAGGAFCHQIFSSTDHRTRVSIVQSNFSHNKAPNGSIFFTKDTDVYINSSNFDSNTEHFHYEPTRGLMHLMGEVHLIMQHSIVHNNTGHIASVIHMDERRSTAKIESSQFRNNAGWFGGVILAVGELILNKCTFSNNTGFQGGVLFLQQCSVTVQECKFHENFVQLDVIQLAKGYVPAGGVIMGANSHVTIKSTNFSSNRAENGVGGAIVLPNNVTLIVDTCSFSENQALSGGAIYAKQSTVVFKGRCKFDRNRAIDFSGGAMSAYEESVIYVYNELEISNNTANTSGGGMFLDQSTLKCERHCMIHYKHNKAVLSSGGGIHANNSVVSISEKRSSLIPCSIHFSENDAQLGGGMYLESSSELNIKKSGSQYTHLQHNLFFIANTADHGAALYVNDETFGTCYIPRNCFLQVLSTEYTLSLTYGLESIEFIKNSANKLGSVLYGGLLDRCRVSPGAEIRQAYDVGADIDGISFFNNVSNMSENEGVSISSERVRVCFCGADRQPDCGQTPPTIHVKKGENFSLPLVAVDQVNGPFSDATITAQLNHTESGFGVGQLAQAYREVCSNLTFSILSPYPSEEITLYADGPCRNARKSVLKVKVVFKGCTCPVGFCPRQLDIDNDCVCGCNPQLHPKYITSCDPQTHALTRRGNSWISYLNITNDTNQNSYLTYSYCPLDYCLPPDTNVEINLNLPDGSDVQCQNNRSGLLCGACRPGLSVSLGTSRCISCDGDNDLWWLIPTFIIAGIALVIILLLLNMTVAVGTINGIAFYANIIYSTSSTFFPTSLTKPAYVIVAWLNLDLGFDACFVDGLDTYMKTWLQMAFPTYVIILLIIMIVWSECSMRFSKLIAKRNPVALLATLILLSYTKFLSTIITVLLFITLEYPDGSHKVVWLPDATVDYLSTKHLVLVVLAIIILLVGIIYTFMLLFWQWTQAWTKRKLNHKVCHFFDLYQVPYKSKHRYWPGLLLLARVILYLLFALNQSGNPRINLIGIIIVMLALILLKGVVGQVYESHRVYESIRLYKNLRVYESRMIDILEFTSYINIAAFSATQLYTLQSAKPQTIGAFLSVFITVILFLMILGYHTSVEGVLKLWRKNKSNTEQKHTGKVTRNRPKKLIPFHSSIEPSSATTSILEFPGTESQNDAENYLQLDDNTVVSLESEQDSGADVDSNSPLLDSLQQTELD